MILLKRNPADNKDIFSAVEILRSGGTIIYPTETFYGLGANALNPAAIRQLSIMKKRKGEKTFPLIISDKDMLAGLVEGIPEVAERLIRAFWPGPLTILLRAKKNLPEEIVSEENKVAVRVSSHPVAHAIVSGLGMPLVATSANISGGKSPVLVAEIPESLREAVALVLDYGRLGGVKGSSIVDATVFPPAILRHGDIPDEKILKLFPES